MDLRLFSVAAGLWLGSALAFLTFTNQSRYLILIWLTALTLLFFAFHKAGLLRKWNQVSAVLLGIGLFVGFGISGLRILPLINGQLAKAAKQNATVELSGEIITDPQRSAVTSALDLSTRDFGAFKLKVSKVNYLGHEYRVRLPVNVYVSGKNLATSQSLPLGTELKFLAKLKPGETIRGIAASATALSDLEITSSPPRYQFLATEFRVGLHRALSSAPPEVAGLVPGLALGDVTKVPPNLTSQMKAAGLSHLTAVSGANVTMLITLVLAIGRKFKFKHSTNYFVSVLVLAAFVIVVRPQPSVLRATVMGLVMVYALFSRNQKSPLPALLVSAIVLLIIDPWLAISYGFALSLGATAGLLVLAKNLLDLLDRKLPSRIPEWLVLGLVVTISAQIAVFPILIGLGSVISLGSLPANLISVPLAGPTMILGLVAAILAPVVFPISQLLAWLATVPARGIVYCAEFFASQKWLVIPWPHGVAGVFLALIAVFGGVQLRLNWNQLTSSQHQTALITWIVCISSLWLKPIGHLNYWVPANWQIASCDVGQGDATVVRVAKSEAIVVDVGGDPDLIDTCLSQLHIKKIPLLLLTHFHADHVVGLPGALHDREVGQIRISPLADPPLTTKFVYDVLGEFNKSADVMAYPEYLKIGKVELTCIWPDRIVTEGTSPNNASVSLFIKNDETNLTLLLPGDIEQLAQDEIVAKIPDFKVDVIKVPHHGSRNQSQIFAQHSGARLALVSVGKNNDYGHPAKETIFLYESIGAKVIRTDRHGSVAVSKTGSNLAVKTQN